MADSSAGEIHNYTQLPKLPADNYTAWPVADQALSQEILDLIQQCAHYRQLKKGANE